MNRARARFTLRQAAFRRRKDAQVRAEFNDPRFDGTGLAEESTSSEGDQSAPDDAPVDWKGLRDKLRAWPVWIREDLLQLSMIVRDMSAIAALSEEEAAAHLVAVADAAFTSAMDKVGRIEEITGLRRTNFAVRLGAQ